MTRTSTIDEDRWNAVLARDSKRRRLVRLRRVIDGHLLQAVLRQPPAAPRPRRLLRHAADAAQRAGYRACKRCQSRRGGRARSVDRESPARVRVSRQCRRPRVAGASGRAPRRQPVSLPAQLQAHRRRQPARYADACRLREDEARPARRDARDRRDARRRLRIEQPLLRAGRVEARDEARVVSAAAARARRSRTRSSIRRSDACWSRRRPGASARSRWASSDAELVRALEARISGGDAAATPIAALGNGRGRSSGISRDAGRGSSCRSTSRRPRFSGRSGTRSPGSPMARRAHIKM